MKILRVAFSGIAVFGIDIRSSERPGWRRWCDHGGDRGKSGAVSVPALCFVVEIAISESAIIRPEPGLVFFPIRRVSTVNQVFEKVLSTHSNFNCVSRMLKN